MPGLTVALTAGTGMSGVLADITSIFTAAMEWVGTVITTVKGEPLLLIGCILPFIGVGVGLFKRLLNI